MEPTPASSAGLPPVVGSPVRMLMMRLTPKTEFPARLYASSKVLPQAVSHAFTWNQAEPPGGVMPAMVTVPPWYSPGKYWPVVGLKSPTWAVGDCAVNADEGGWTVGLFGSTAAQYSATEKVVPPAASTGIPEDAS